MAILGALAAGAGLGLATKAVGGTLGVLATRGERRRKQRLEGLLKGKFATTKAYSGAARGVREQGKRTVDSETRSAMADLERKRGSGYNPMLVQKELDDLRRMRMESLARYGTLGEQKAAGMLAGKRAEIRSDISRIPSAFDRFMQGAGMANQALSTGMSAYGTAADVAATGTAGGPGPDGSDPSAVEDLANNF